LLLTLEQVLFPGALNLRRRARPVTNMLVSIVFQTGRPARARHEPDLARPYAARHYAARLTFRDGRRAELAAQARPMDYFSGRAGPTGPSARRARPARPLPCHARSRRRKSHRRGSLERGKEFPAGSGGLGLVEACSVVAAAPWLVVAPTGAAGGAAPGRRPEGERVADATMHCAPCSGS
jgi:hypothetical protein